MSEKYLVDWTNRFKKDYKLANGEELPPENHDHPLIGN